MFFRIHSIRIHGSFVFKYSMKHDFFSLCRNFDDNRLVRLGTSHFENLTQLEYL